MMAEIEELVGQVLVPDDRGANAEETVHIPGPNKRVCAALIDFLLIGVVQGSVGLIMGGGFLVTLVYWFLFLIRDGFNGKSPGKRFVGLQATDLDGRPTSLALSLKRNFLRLIPFVPLVEYVALRMDPQGRRLGDKIAKSLVVDLSPERSESRYLVLSLVVIGGQVAVTALFYLMGYPSELPGG